MRGSPRSVPPLRSSPALLVVAGALVSFAAPDAFAQRGVVHGHIRGVDGAPLAYANIMLEWTTAGAMSDKRGYYSMNAPVGRHVVKAMMMGHITRREAIAVGNGDTVTVDFVLAEDPDYDPSNVIVIDPRQRKPGQPLDVYEDPWPYDASTEPVHWESLEFELRYVLTQVGDSVIVNVVAEATNRASAPFVVCGRFTFMSAIFVISSESYTDAARIGGRMRYEGSTLDVPEDSFASPSLECESVQVGPGELIARGMTFSFDPEKFKFWTGEVGTQCYFYAGTDGQAFSEIWRINLGQIRIPIRPIGQPLRTP